MKAKQKTITHIQPRMTALQKTIVWAAGIILCLVVAYSAFKLEISDEENNFKTQSDLVYDELTRRYSTLEAVLTALTGFHQASNHVNEVQFTTFAQELLNAYPYIRSAISLRKLDNKDRQTLENEKHELGYFQFQVSQSTYDHRLVPASTRPEYLIIDVIEPLQPHMGSLLGYDVLPNSNFSHAINSATRTGKSVASSFTYLLQKNGGILIFKAVYQGRYAPRNADDRVSMFNGAIAIEVGADGLLSNLVPETMNLSISLSQNNKQSNGRFEYSLAKDKNLQSGTSLLPALTTTRTLNLYGQETQLSVSRQINFRDLNYYWTFFSVIATLLVYIATLSSWRHRLTDKRHAQELAGYAASAAFSEENTDPIMRINRNGIILYSNEPGLKILHEWSTDIGQQSPENIKYFIRDVLQYKQYQELEISTDSRHFTLRFIPGSTRNYVNIYGRDDTEQKQAEIELREAKHAAETANVAKSRFLATISHEVRTPMNGILGMLELLQSSKLDERQGRFTETALRSGRILLSLINDILDFSKMESSKLKLDLYDFELNDIIDDVVQIIAEPMLIKRLHLITDIPKHDFHLVGDKQRLRQVLINLAGNAVKFTEYGQITIRAVVLDESNDAMLLKIEIEDTGIGIKADAVDHIFDAFTQEDDSITRRFGGTGLGLAIVKQLTTLMGGEIDVQSTPTKGSTFSVTLPFEKQTPMTEHDDSDTIQETASIYLSPQGNPKPNPQVLLAEDNQINQEVEVAMLESAGCEVTIVNDGELALQALKNKHFDLVLMDCQMPGMDGLEATRQVRQRQSEYAHIPIIAITANVQKHAREECQKAGMNDYLSKPFTQAEIREIIARWSPTE